MKLGRRLAMVVALVLAMFSVAVSLGAPAAVSDNGAIIVEN